MISFAVPIFIHIKCLMPRTDSRRSPAHGMPHAAADGFFRDESTRFGFRNDAKRNDGVRDISHFFCVLVQYQMFRTKSLGLGVIAYWWKTFCRWKFSVMYFFCWNLWWTLFVDTMKWHDDSIASENLLIEDWYSDSDVFGFSPQRSWNLLDRKQKTLQNLTPHVWINKT